MSINRIVLATVAALLLSACATVSKDNLKEILAEKTRAETLYKSGEYESAITAYKRLLASVPGLAETWMKLGNSYGRLQDFPNAIAAYEEALSLDPTYVKVWYNLSYVRAQQLASTVVSMYQNVPKDDPSAVKIRALVEGVLAPFGGAVLEQLPTYTQVPDTRNVDSLSAAQMRREQEAPAELQGSDSAATLESLSSAIPTDDNKMKVSDDEPAPELHKREEP